MSLAIEGGGRFDLLEPGLLALAALVPLALLLRARRGPPAVPFAAASLARGLPASARTRLRHAPVAFRAAALLLLVFALARPVERVPQPRTVVGLDALLCLDVSSSMAARDLAAARTRLEVAKDAAAAFVAGRPEDRFGLIVFAAYADLLAPPTLDHAALAAILQKTRTVEPDAAEDRTGIGGALARGARVLRGSAAKSRVLILLTDGEENVATAEAPHEITPLQAAQLCRSWGVRVYAIAAGSAAEAVVMRGVAEATGGGFFAARNADALAGAYAQIGALERSELAATRYTLREWYWPFLLAALALLCGGRLLETARGGPLP